jgi:hypothetical protein
MSIQPRHPQGIPSGGQFRDKEHGEAPVTLQPGALPLEALQAIATDSGLELRDLQRLHRDLVEAGATPHSRELDVVVARWRDEELTCNRGSTDASGYTIKRAARHLLELGETGTFTSARHIRSYELETMAASEMSPQDAADWTVGQANHRINPVIGWLALDAGDQAKTAKHHEALQRRIGLLGQDVARKLAHRPTPEAVEEAMHQEWHSDQCGCDRPDDVCATFGEHWRGSWSIPNVHHVFEVMQRLENQAADASPRPPAN